MRKRKSKRMEPKHNGFRIEFWRDGSNTLNMTVDSFNNLPNFFKSTSGLGLDAGMMGRELFNCKLICVEELFYLNHMFRAFHEAGRIKFGTW